ncbi:MAG: type IV pilus assembly protein PilM [Candidatus Omnitrophica bacterium]|nr:Cell division protein FtsA [bacterium]NUN94693.1 type IV pilus assembly protein PilM [Candidatus Omnitrophota bacterium]
MRFWKPKKYPAIGLDIGHSSVKGLELKGSVNELVVDRFGSAPIRAGMDSPSRKEAVVQAVRELYSQVGFSTKHVVTAVSGESVIVRVIRLPYFSEKESQELHFAVQSEAQDFIPFDMADVAFDYQRLGVVDAGAEGKALEVLIVAAQKEMVAWHSDVVRAAGLDPRVVDIGSFALVNAVHHGARMTPHEPIALVDIGSAVTNIAIMKEDTTRFTRDLSTAGATITRAIMSELGLDERAAEAAKLDHGIGYGMEEGSGEGEEMFTLSQSNLPDMMEQMKISSAGEGAVEGVDQRVNAICEQFLGEIVSEIKRCLLFYENQLDGQAVEKVYLTGGTVQMKNADQYIQNLLDTPTEVIDPFAGIGGAIASLDPLARGAMYTTSLGLAMRSLIGGGVS